MVENKRYIGEVYIDPDTDELFQSFMHNILNVYSGPGKGFDADTLDGMHWDGDSPQHGIKQYIDAQIPTDDKTYLTQIDIKDKTFSGDKINITLDADDIDAIDNRSNTTTDTIENVQDALRLLWAGLEETQDNQDNIIPLLESFQSAIQTDQGDTYINADRVNNVRIIPVTQNVYNDLSSATSGTDEYEYFNDPRNLFIISEKAASDNTVDTGLHYSLKTGYDFRLNDGILQYKHVYTDDDRWSDVADVSNLLDLSEDNSKLSQLVSQLVCNIIENNTDLAYNQNALTDSLNGIDLGYIYNIKYNNNYLTKSIDNNTSSKYIDLTGILNNISTPLNQSITNLNESIQRIDQEISDIRNQIQQINNSMSTIVTEDNMNTSIANATNDLQTQINQLYTSGWITKNFTSNNWKNDNGISTITYNPKLHICIVHIKTTHKHVTANNNKTVNRNGSSTISYLPANIKPTTKVWIPITASRYVILNSNGSIQFYCTSDVSAGEFSITNHSTFFYQ